MLSGYSRERIPAVAEGSAVPTYRSDLLSIPRYVPGKPIEEVARELGLESIDKLASNECPTEPFSEVVEAIADAARSVNRYPDNDTFALRRDLGEFHGTDPDSIWVGSGSSDLLRSIAIAVGGEGTSLVYADPSFILYRMCALLTGSSGVPVPLTQGFDHDLEAMLAAFDGTTTAVFVCNPNNPTGNHLSGESVEKFIAAVPEEVLVVVDEAYAEYVTAESFASMVPLAPRSTNVVVLRTFSKVYGLAGLRVGYAVGHADTLSALKRTQGPFAVTSLAQAAAVEALKHQSRVQERVVENAAGRRVLADALVARGYKPAPTETNFVYFEPDEDPRALADRLLRHGSIVRVLGPGVRVSVGTDAENRRFVAALDSARSA